MQAMKVPSGISPLYRATISGLSDIHQRRYQPNVDLALERHSLEHHPSPNIGTGSNYLEAGDALSANDVWAAGFFVNGATKQSLILHWNGSNRSVSPSTNAGSNDTFLYDAEAVTAGDAWAVGYYYDGPVERTLILRWNGSTWIVVSSPNSGANTNGLQGVTV